MYTSDRWCWGGSCQSDTRGRAGHGTGHGAWDNIYIWYNFFPGAEATHKSGAAHGLRMELLCLSFFLFLLFFLAPITLINVCCELLQTITIIRYVSYLIFKYAESFISIRVIQIKSIIIYWSFPLLVVYNSIIFLCINLINANFIPAIC